MSSMMTTVLPTPAPPKRANFAAFQEGLNEVDDLDAGFKHFGFGCSCSLEGGASAVDRHPFLERHGAEVVDGLSDNVHHAAQGAAANGNGNRAAEIDGIHAAHHAVGRLHGDAAHAALAKMLLHFKDHVDRRGTLKLSLTTRRA